MASYNIDFVSVIDAWCDETLQVATAVFHDATATVISEMSTPVHQGGPLPYRTGNLRRSLWVSTTAMPEVSTDYSIKYDEVQDYTAEVLSAEIGDTIYAGFRAPYGPRVNYGFVGEDSLGRSYNQSGYGFVEYATLLWPSIVAGAVERNRRT